MQTNALSLSQTAIHHELTYYNHHQAKPICIQSALSTLLCFNNSRLDLRQIIAYTLLLLGNHFRLSL